MILELWRLCITPEALRIDIKRRESREYFGREIERNELAELLSIVIFNCLPILRSKANEGQIKLRAEHCRRMANAALLTRHGGVGTVRIDARRERSKAGR